MSEFPSRPRPLTTAQARCGAPSTLTPTSTPLRPVRTREVSLQFVASTPQPARLDLLRCQPRSGSCSDPQRHTQLRHQHNEHHKGIAAFSNGGRVPREIFLRWPESTVIRHGRDREQNLCQELSVQWRGPSHAAYLSVPARAPHKL